MFTKNQAREELYQQYQQVNDLIDQCFRHRMDAIHLGDTQVSLRYAIEMDVLSTKRDMLFAQYYGYPSTGEGIITARLSWYDERSLPVVTDYDEYMQIDVNGLPRWLADLNATLAA